MLRILIKTRPNAFKIISILKKVSSYGRPAARTGNPSTDMGFTEDLGKMS